MIPYSKIRNITTGYAVATDAGTSEGVKKSWMKRERAKKEAQEDTLDKSKSDKYALGKHFESELEADWKKHGLEKKCGQNLQDFIKQFMEEAEADGYTIGKGDIEVLKQRMEGLKKIAPTAAQQYMDAVAESKKGKDAKKPSDADKGKDGDSAKKPTYKHQKAFESAIADDYKKFNLREKTGQTLSQFVKSFIDDFVADGYKESPENLDVLKQRVEGLKKV